MTNEDLPIYTVYERPSDYPHHYVCHRIRPSGEVEVERQLFAWAGSLEDLRAKLPPGLFRLVRHPEDDPVIVETWI